MVALLGDGAMQLNGLAELITVAHHWREWRDPRLVVLVLNNRDQSGLGNGRWVPGVPGRRADVPYAGWARLLGLHGVRVDRPELVGAAWDEALAADRPCVLEAVVDPTVSLRVPEPALADLRSVFADGDADPTRCADRMVGPSRSIVEAEDLVSAPLGAAHSPSRSAPAGGTPGGRPSAAGPVPGLGGSRRARCTGRAYRWWAEDCARPVAGCPV